MGKLKLSSPELIELAEDLIGRRSRFRFRVRGTSMRPWIGDGDMLEFEPLFDRPPGIGEVVLCKLPGDHVVAHRVLGRARPPAGSFYRIGGDANPFVDGLIPADQILARAVAVRRDGRTTRLDTRRVRTLAWLWALSASPRRFGIRLVRHIRELIA